MSLFRSESGYSLNFDIESDVVWLFYSDSFNIAKLLKDENVVQSSLILSKSFFEWREEATDSPVEIVKYNLKYVIMQI